jgi:PhnB protein
MAVPHQPEGYGTVTPYLMTTDSEAVIEFAKRALDAGERMRMPGPGGGIGHAELLIGDSVVMLADETPENTMPGMLHVYVEDCDATYARALEAGGTSLAEPADQVYGERMAGVQDPSGNKWYFATHIEDLSEQEMVGRVEGLVAGAGSDGNE